MRGLLFGTLAPAAFLSAMLASAPAAAEIVARTDSGFTVRAVAEVAASPEETWKELVHPADWWDGEHTFSGKAANLSLDPVAGGCFCETLPPAEGAPKGTKPGGVEHMRVIYVQPGFALRMIGALGPLQSEAVNATLTVTLKSTGKGTRILWEYVVGGYMRYPQDKIAPAVDQVIGAQLSGLALKLGPAVNFDLAPGKKIKDKAGDEPAVDAKKPSEGDDTPPDQEHKQANEALDKALSPDRA